MKHLLGSKQVGFYVQMTNIGKLLYFYATKEKWPPLFAPH